MTGKYRGDKKIPLGYKAVIYNDNIGAIDWRLTYEEGERINKAEVETRC